MGDPAGADMVARMAANNRTRLSRRRGGTRWLSNQGYGELTGTKYPPSRVLIQRYAFKKNHTFISVTATLGSSIPFILTHLSCVSHSGRAFVPFVYIEPRRHDVSL